MALHMPSEEELASILDRDTDRRLQQEPPKIRREVERQLGGSQTVQRLASPSNKNRRVRASIHPHIKTMRRVAYYEDPMRHQSPIVSGTLSSTEAEAIRQSVRSLHERAQTIR